MYQKNFIQRVEGRLLWVFAPWIKDDKLYLKLSFKNNLGYSLNLENPQTFNEKIQWLKLNNRHPEFTRMVDKVEAKKYVASIIGGDYIIPTLGVWDKAEDIDFNSLPNQFVLKCTHDSGGVVVCKDKTKLDKEAAVRKLSRFLKRRYFAYTREYPYKDVKPRIIAEQYVVDESGYELKDYKIFCMNDKPKFLFVASDRQSKTEDTKFDFYDTEWNRLPVRNGHPNSQSGIRKPDNFDKMLKVAESLASSISTPFVRIDLYNSCGKILFGEITFFHNSGFVPFDPDEWDYKFGSLIKLRTDK